MLVLAIDCSAVSASAAIVDGTGRLIGNSFLNNGLTHSQTLLPMVTELLSDVNLDLNDIDAFAVSAGPGSFTGVRIGVSAIKGMAVAENKPCVSVSTLDAMAAFAEHNCDKDFYRDTLLCAVMDARCGQVYNALYKLERGKAVKITKDRALMIAELQAELNAYNTITLIGDGAEVCRNNMPEIEQKLVVPPDEYVYQNAMGVALSALKQYKEGSTLTAAELMPIYLRVPQAERELKKKGI